MCYYNGRFVSRIEYIRLKEMERSINALEKMNVKVQSGFEYAEWPVVVPVAGKNEIDIVDMEWGFLPSTWPDRETVKLKRSGYKDAKGKYNPPILTLNAKGEELLFPYKMYRDAALHRRCLVPSNGFFEWRHILRANKKTGLPLKTPDKYPYHIHLNDVPYFFMAGIWQPWTDQKTGEFVNTFAIVTTKANALMEQIHNSQKRMPTILDEDLAQEWISDGLSEERITAIATTQFPADLMDAYTVDKNFIKADDPYRPFEYPDLPALAK